MKFSMPSAVTLAVVAGGAELEPDGLEDGVGSAPGSSSLPSNHAATITTRTTTIASTSKGSAALRRRGRGAAGGAAGGAGSTGGTAAMTWVEVGSGSGGAGI